MAVVQLQFIERASTVVTASYKGQKGEENTPCFAKTKKEHLKESRDTFMFQKGQVFVVPWIEKKGRKPVMIASTTTSPTWHCT